MITISIVSHAHGNLVQQLLDDLSYLQVNAKVVLTLNIPERYPIIPKHLVDKVLVLSNSSPKGFAQNHNNAFNYCDTPFFCVLNPDVRINQDPFPELIRAIEKAGVGMSAPIVVNRFGDVEDSVRYFPTPWRILIKAIFRTKSTYVINKNDDWLFPEWVAGMCMLFNSSAYKILGGFDESYFLYYEDVDICARLWKNQLGLAVCPSVMVMHDARRTSHRELKFLRWHLTSMMKFFIGHLGRLPSVDR